MATLPYQQSSFDEGMDLYTERSRMVKEFPSRYPLLVNARSRFGKLVSVRKPLKLTAGLPSASQTVYQGLYSAGSYAIVFAGGNAYSRNFADETTQDFLRINNLNLSAGVSEIYFELVPASTLNYTRIPSDITNLRASIELSGDLISPSPVAAVVQDGINQPWLIFGNGQARQAQTYEQWLNSPNGREYVPVGKQMAFVDNILYVVSPDGNLIYRSVSGRPVDFMVIIDANGNKLPTEREGGAANISHKVFYDAITCIGKVPSTPEFSGTFYVGSSRQSALVSPDFSDLIFGEPNFTNNNFTNTGAKNQFSFLGDVNGDSCFIDDYGVRSFNAIMTVKNAGKNSPFSLLISPLFTDAIQQTITACGQFNNYSCFAVKTVYGNTVIWFDDLRGVWDSIDLYSEVTGQIRQFAEIITNTGMRKLLFLTSDGGIYEMFNDSQESETATFYFGDTCTQDTKVMQKVNNLNVVVQNSQSDGIINATLFVDDKKQNTTPLTKNVNRNYTPSGSISLPFGAATENVVDNVMFDFNQSQSGWSIGAMLQWNFACEISELGMIASPVGGINNVKRQAIELRDTKSALGII